MAPAPSSQRIRASSIAETLQNHLDPSTLPFLRAFALGYLAETLPALVKAVSKRKGKSAFQIVLQLVKALKFKPRGGLAVAFAIAVGGGKYGERLLEPVVRRVYLKARDHVKARANSGKGKEKEVVLTEEEELEELKKEHKIVQTITTACSATISSFFAILVLQSSPSYRRPSTPLAVSTDPKLDFSVSPYTFTTTAKQVRPSGREGRRKEERKVQSPTLDITLFVFIRAVDTLVRGLYHHTGATDGRFGPVTTFIASNADTLTFALSCFVIMRSWFYFPEALPPSYNRWILNLARMDKRLLELLRYARNGRFVYGKRPDQQVLEMCHGIAQGAGKDISATNPEFISRFSCAFVHGQVGKGSCEMNATKRWARAFLDCLLIYLPVHAIPPLLFNFSKVLSQPGSSILRILLAASRSSAFLATFVASIYASVCLVRTRIPSLFPRGFIPQQPLDGGLAVYLGCIMCGLSLLIENKRRRREMALFTATRALYAVVDDVLPSFITQGQTGEFLTKWLERIVFSTSAGTVIAATVHRPDLVSGVVKGVVGVAVKDWHGKKKTT
ncbi:uncharacterized protein JCM6883_004354 [Sporobolomyces salmoneus]|uniref:uncharacterized protein n=1 Tax=Sporobolomyces salmoneus TaxID=183962 RepID=UPI0031800FC9